MYNSCRDQSMIKKAFTDGLIELKDYQKYNQIIKSKQALKKSKEQGALSVTDYESELSNSEDFEFTKSIEGGKLKFKLAVINEFKTKDEDSDLSKGLEADISSKRVTQSRSSSYSVPPAISRVVSEITKMAEKLKRK